MIKRLCVFSATKQAVCFFFFFKDRESEASEETAANIISDTCFMDAPQQYM